MKKLLWLTPAFLLLAIVLALPDSLNAADNVTETVSEPSFWGIFDWYVWVIFGLVFIALIVLVVLLLFFPKKGKGAQQAAHGKQQMQPQQGKPGQRKGQRPMPQQGMPMRPGTPPQPGMRPQPQQGGMPQQGMPQPMPPQGQGQFGQPQQAGFPQAPGMQPNMTPQPQQQGNSPQPQMQPEPAGQYGQQQQPLPRVSPQPMSPQPQMQGQQQPRPGPRPMPQPMQPQPMMPQGYMQQPQAFGGRIRPVFSIGNLNIFPSQVKEGDPVTVSAVITNSGSAQGKYSAVLRVDNVVEDIAELTLNPGASQTATFTLAKDIAGEYVIELDNLRGTLFVIPKLPAAFTVSNLTITPDRVSQGKPIAISITITNTGERPGIYNASLKIKGVTEISEDIPMEPLETKEVVFNIAKDVAGFYPVQFEHMTGRFVIEMDWNP